MPMPEMLKSLFDYVEKKYGGVSASGSKGLIGGDTLDVKSEMDRLQERGILRGSGSGGGGDIEDALKPKGMQRKRVM
jgi:hypothetical protein